LANSCYKNMFQGCKSLVNAPQLPATTLATACYQHMFTDCTSLKRPPNLPATTLAIGCYHVMFYNCTSLKVSATQTGNYNTAWRIPTSGSSNTAVDWNLIMLQNTGGTFTSSPQINTTYYLDVA